MGGKPTIALCLEYPLGLRGGVSVLVETLLRGLNGHHELVLVSPDSRESLAESAAADMVGRHIPWNPGAVSGQTSRMLAGQLAEAGVTLAHFHFGGNYGWGSRFYKRCPIPYANALGVRTCSTVHLVTKLLEGYCGPQKPWWFKLALLPAAWLGKMHVLAHLRREIAVSQHDLRKLRRWYWPRRGRFLQFYHSRIQPDGSQMATAPREPLVLNVGHIAWRKGQLVLCEAFARIAARHPDWKLCLVGKMMERDIEEKIRRIVTDHHLTNRIQFQDEQKEVVGLMRRAAIYAQPSYQEALGLALQEALFAGCASVGTTAGGIPELIEHERNGLMVAPGDLEALAAALERLITNAALRERFGREGAASIVRKGMTAEAMVTHHVELYESILHEG